MSYILDALKKSDQERQQGDVPDLQTVHVPVSVESVPVRWPYIVIGALLLSLAFVLGMLRPWDSDSVESSVEQASESHKEELKIDAPVANNSVAKENKATRSVVEAVPETRPEKIVAPIKEKIAKPVVVEQKTVVKSSSYDTASSVQHLQDMPEMVQQAIPEMVFAGHVYSSDAAQRSVIINDHYMNEGDVVIVGLKVERITPKGVIFDYNGQLFRTDILQDWSFD